MPKAPPRSYHHGSLRQAVIDAAVAEVEAVGAANLSMREIARRAGVSHAAPAHHFGDKAGIFTAIAIEGFRLITEAVAPAASGRDGFFQGGLAYIQFALAHPGYFEVMFQPELFWADDAELVAAREAAFAVLFDSAAAALPADQADDATALAVAGLSIAHGFAALWRHGNLQDRLGSDLAAVPAQLIDGVVALGKVTRRQSRAIRPSR